MITVTMRNGEWAGEPPFGKWVKAGTKWTNRDNVEKGAAGNTGVSNNGTIGSRAVKKGFLTLLQGVPQEGPPGDPSRKLGALPMKGGHTASTTETLEVERGGEKRAVCAQNDQKVREK